MRSTQLESDRERQAFPDLLLLQPRLSSEQLLTMHNAVVYWNNCLIRYPLLLRVGVTFPTPPCRRISTSHELEAAVVRGGSFTTFILLVILPSPV